MELIRSRNITVSVHWSGLAACAALSLLGLAEPLWLTLAALLLHESGHLLAAKLVGAPIRHLELTPFGGVAELTQDDAATVGERLCVSLAGIAMNLVAYACVLWFCEPTRGWCFFARVNLCIALFNLLPALPLDGGRALYALCEALPHAQTIRKGMYIFALFVGTSMTVLAIYGAWNGAWNASLMISGPYLCYAARKSYLTRNIQAIERAMRFRNSMQKRGVMRVDAYACRDNLSRDEWIRAWMQRRENRYHFVVEVNSETGRVVRMLDEIEIVQRILNDKKAD